MSVAADLEHGDDRRQAGDARYRPTTRPASPTWKRPRPSRPRARPSRPRAQLKSECEQQYKSLQQEVLGFLISSSWVLGEAESLGVQVTDAEVKKQFEKIKNEQFPKAAEFKKFLATLGPDRLRSAAAREAEPALAKIQQKIAKREDDRHARPKSKSTTTNTSRSYGTPEKRDVEIVLTKTEAQAKAAKKEIESGKSFAESPRASRSIRPARPTAAS